MLARSNHAAELLVSVLGVSHEPPVLLEEVRPATGGDAPFEPFIYGGTTYEFPCLPVDVRGYGLTWLFYGKPMSDPAQACTHAARLFAKGREGRGKPHRDVGKHQKGTSRAGNGISGFFQTSKDFSIVSQKYLFDRRRVPTFGLLYLIDARGAAVLDVDRFCAWVGRSEPENGDSEVLFSGSIPAVRIGGAGIFRSEQEGHLELLKLLLNPNYLGEDCSVQGSPGLIGTS